MCGQDPFDLKLKYGGRLLSLPMSVPRPSFIVSRCILLVCGRLQRCQSKKFHISLLFFTAWSEY